MLNGCSEQCFGECTHLEFDCPKRSGKICSIATGTKTYFASADDRDSDMIPVYSDEDMLEYVSLVLLEGNKYHLIDDSGEVISRNVDINFK